MENRLTRVREILDTLVDQNGGSPYHSGKGRFWNLSRDVFVDGPIAGRKPIEVGLPADSFLVKILKGDVDGLRRMPLDGPYISDADLAFIEQWITDGAPDIEDGMRAAGRLSLQQLTDDLKRIPLKLCHEPLGCLKESLREAIRIEFFTIPPYLTAWWSIDTNGGDPDGARGTIFSVALEEMLHMGLVSNMLAAISQPNEVVDYRAFAPTYPSKLPGGVRPHLTVALRKLDRDQFLAFTDVESFADSTSGIDTIGEFYTALAAAFAAVKPPLSETRQVEKRYERKPWLVKLKTEQDVLNAIDLIQRQGEGRPGAGDPYEDPNDHSKGMGHYFQFSEFYHGKKYIQVNGVWGFTGDPKGLPALYNMADIPSGGYDPNTVVPEAKTPLLKFRSVYTQMIDAFTEAWSVNPSVIGEAIQAMYSLGTPAQKLMTINLPNSPQAYGPDFKI